MDSRYKWLSSINYFLLDLDGTVYLGNSSLPGALEFIDYLKSQGKKFLFLTNNSSQTAMYYVDKLKKMGISVSNNNVFTSGEATCMFLKTLNSKPKVYLLGTPALEEEFKKNGIELTEDDPEYVVIGFDMTLTYEKLKKACLFIRNGKKFIATHPDLNCPTEEGLIPDAGSIIAAIRASTGLEPEYILGKPRKEFIEEALRKIQAKKAQTAIIGDRLYTDIKSGLNADIKTILVLTGETRPTDLEKTNIKPHLIIQSLEDLLHILKSLH